MSTNETLNDVEDHQTFQMVVVKLIIFKYPEPCSDHNKAKHLVDNHNNRRHDPIDIADMWRTKRWSNWQYSFIFALSEVNVNSCWSHARSQPKEPQLEFWRNMAIAMIKKTLDDNEHTVPVLKGPRRRSMGCKTISEHKMETKPFVHQSGWE